MRICVLFCLQFLSHVPDVTNKRPRGGLFCSFFATIQNLPLAGSASLHLQLFRAAAGAARLAHLRSKVFQGIIHVLSKSSI